MRRAGRWNAKRRTSSPKERPLSDGRECWASGEWPPAAGDCLRLVSGRQQSALRRHCGRVAAPQTVAGDCCWRAAITHRRSADELPPGSFLAANCEEAAQEEQQRATADNCAQFYIRSALFARNRPTCSSSKVGARHSPALPKRPTATCGRPLAGRNKCL